MKANAGTEKTPKPPLIPMLALMVLGAFQLPSLPHAWSDTPRTPNSAQILLRDEQSRKLAEEILKLEKQNEKTPSPVLNEQIALKKMGRDRLDQGTESLEKELLTRELETVLAVPSEAGFSGDRSRVGATDPDRLEKSVALETMGNLQASASNSGQVAPAATLTGQGK